jgi:hypothetical protein
VIGLEFPVAFFGVGVLLQLSYHRTRWMEHFRPCFIICPRYVSIMMRRSHHCIYHSHSLSLLLPLRRTWLVSKFSDARDDPERIVKIKCFKWVLTSQLFTILFPWFFSS